jgi:DNA-binding GntR family transcriptional regulator
MHSPLHCRFLDDSGEGYLPVYSKVTGRVEIDEPGPWSRHLGESFPLLRIDRVLDVNKEFAVFSHFYVDPRRMPAFARMPVRKLCGENFKEIIWRESHQPVSRFTQHLSSVVFPPEVARATGAKRGTQGLLLEARAYLNGDSPIYFQQLYIPSNTRRLHLAGD